MRRRRFPLPELLLALGSLLATAALLLVLELALRVLRPCPCPDACGGSVMACLHAYSEVYGWELRRDFWLERDGVRYTTNSAGYRGRLHSGERDGTHTRLLMLGDSVGYGLDVDDEQIFSRRLEVGPGGYQVVNLSVAGYGTDQELLRLRHEGLGFHPDVVLVHFCRANDFADNMLSSFLYNGVHPKPYFTLEGDRLELHDSHLRLSPSGRLAQWLGERSQLYNAALAWTGTAARLARAREARGETLPHWETRANEALLDQARVLRLTARLLREMRDLLAPSRARLVVLAYPMRATFDDEGSDLVGQLAGRAEAEGIPFVLMGERFREKGRLYRELTSDGLGHLNPLGHQVTAEIVREVLEELRLDTYRASTAARS
jgi:hypothetical protein